MKQFLLMVLLLGFTTQLSAQNHILSAAATRDGQGVTVMFTIDSDVYNVPGSPYPGIYLAVNQLIVQYSHDGSNWSTIAQIQPSPNAATQVVRYCHHHPYAWPVPTQGRYRVQVAYWGGTAVYSPPIQVKGNIGSWHGLCGSSN
jgi:hypothetical protein